MAYILKMTDTINLKRQISKEEIMRDIEEKTNNKIKEAMRTGNISNPISVITGIEKKDKVEQSIEVLENIMKSGANEFESKVGRKMTYAEMRAMYG